MADAVLVVTTGLTLITTALVNLGEDSPKFVQWGVGDTAPTTTDVDLELKTGCNEARVNTDAVVATATVDGLTDDTFRVTALITKAGAIAAITEVATFDSIGAGTPPDGDVMFLRATFDAINLVIGNSIDFTIDTKFVPV